MTYLSLLLIKCSETNFRYTTANPQQFRPPGEIAKTISMRFELQTLQLKHCSCIRAIANTVAFQMQAKSLLQHKVSTMSNCHYQLEQSVPSQNFTEHLDTLSSIINNELT